MKALAICGSPRENGNTVRLLTGFLVHREKAGHETKRIRIKGLDIIPCDDRLSGNLAWLAEKLA